MNSLTGDEIILTLAKMLVGKKIDPRVMEDSLKLICNSFSFDCGLVYELDQKNVFHLSDRCLQTKIPLCEQFAEGEIAPQYRTCLAQRTLTCLEEKKENTPEEAKLLDLFSAALLVIAPIVDEADRMMGFIAFTRMQAKTPLSKEERETLEVLFNLLGRYLKSRLDEKKISFAQRTLENILDNTGIDIYVNDFYTHEILYVNRSMAAPYGGKEQFYNRKCWEVLYPGQVGSCVFCPQEKLIDEHGNPTKVYTWDYQRPFDGAWFRVFSAAFRWVDGRLAHIVSSADITENKRNEELVRYLANYDPLTKLPNRRMLVQECEHRIDKATEREQGYLLFFDIDGFKNINDSFGHDAGDEFLVMLGEFFSGIPDLKDAIYRNGGDEFVAVIGGEDVTKDNVRDLTQVIHARFKLPWVLKKGSVFCSTSIGIACYPEDGVTAETLLYKADQAMYQVKKRGGADICFGYEVK